MESRLGVVIIIKFNFYVWAKKNIIIKTRKLNARRKKAHIQKSQGSELDEHIKN